MIEPMIHRGRGGAADLLRDASLFQRRDAMSESALPRKTPTAAKPLLKHAVSELETAISQAHVANLRPDEVERAAQILEHAKAQLLQKQPS